MEVGKNGGLTEQQRPFRLKDLLDDATGRVKLAGSLFEDAVKAPRGRFDKSGIGECFVQPALRKAERPCGTSDEGVTSLAVPAGVVGGTARIAHNVKKKPNERYSRLFSGAV